MKMVLSLITVEAIETLNHPAVTNPTMKTERHAPAHCRRLAMPDFRMSRVAATLLPLLTAFLAGCAASDVKYTDLQPATTATITGDTVTVHLGSDMRASACFTRPKATVEGRTVYIVGYRTLREQSHNFVVQLPVSTSPRLVSVVWVDPDGSRVAVPITK